MLGKIDIEKFLGSRNAVKKPSIISKSKSSYKLKKIDRGTGIPSAGEICQYNVLKTFEGPIVGGVGVPGHPPNAHTTHYKEIEESYFGIIKSVEERTIETKNQVTTTKKIKIEGLCQDYGILIKRGKSIEDILNKDMYIMKIVRLEPFEIIEGIEQNDDISSAFDLPGELSTELKKPSDETLENIFEALSPYHLQKLGIEKTTVTKYTAPDGTEIYVED